MADQSPDTMQSGRRGDFRLTLNRLLFGLSRFGSSAVVGWKPSAKGLELILLPRLRLFQLEQPDARLFEGSRLCDKREFREILRVLGVQPMEIRLDFPIGGGGVGLSHEDVETVLSRYSVGFARFRVLFLIDVVGFSKASPEEQASHLSTLKFALSLAEATVRQQGLPMEMARSTTGDGYYVWNLKRGIEADVSLFVLMVLFALYYKSLQREMEARLPLPELRLSVSGGSHYVFYEPSPSYVARHEYIVGAATINAARLIGKARADQILVGECLNDLDPTDVWTAQRYVMAADRLLDGLKDFKLLGNSVGEIRFYLTGPKDDERFRNQKIRIVDKHGFEHICFNAKINTHLKEAESIYAGLQHRQIRWASE